MPKTRFEACMDLDKQGHALKDNLMRYWEVAGLTERELDHIVGTIAMMSRTLGLAMHRPEKKPAAKG